MPASQPRELVRSRQSLAHSGGGKTPSRDSRNRQPHSGPKSYEQNPEAPRADGRSHHRSAPHLLAKGGGAAARIHYHIKHLASGAGHQLFSRLLDWLCCTSSGMPGSCSTLWRAVSTKKPSHHRATAAPAAAPRESPRE